MTGQAETTRVGIPLAIEHEHVGFALQLLKGRKQGRPFAKRQQSGDVWELNGPAGDTLLDDGPAIYVPDHDAGNAVGAIGREGKVRAGNESDGRHWPTGNDPRGKHALDGDGPDGCDGPSVGKSRNLHVLAPAAMLDEHPRRCPRGRALPMRRQVLRKRESSWVAIRRARRRFGQFIIYCHIKSNGRQRGKARPSILPFAWLWHAS